MPKRPKLATPKLNEYDGPVARADGVLLDQAERIDAEIARLTAERDEARAEVERLKRDKETLLSATGRLSAALEQEKLESVPVEALEALHRRQYALATQSFDRVYLRGAKAVLSGLRNLIDQHAGINSRDSDRSVSMTDTGEGGDG